MDGCKIQKVDESKMKIKPIGTTDLIKLGLWQTAIFQSEVNIVSITIRKSHYGNIYMVWQDSDQTLQGSWLWW